MNFIQNKLAFAFLGISTEQHADIDFFMRTHFTNVGDGWFQDPHGVDGFLIWGENSEEAYCYPIEDAFRYFVTMSKTKEAMGLRVSPQSNRIMEIYETHLTEDEDRRLRSILLDYFMIPAPVSQIFPPYE